MPLNNFGIAGPNLWRCAQPDSPGLAALAQWGAEIIFKLNTECPDESAWCKNSDLELVDSPIPTLTNTAATTRAVADKLHGCVQRGLTVVHCEHGRDRTGLVVGAYGLIYGGLTLQQVNAARALYGVIGIFSLFDAEITAVLAEIAAGK